MVARLYERNSEEEIDIEKPYAEFWMGTHDSGPSFVIAAAEEEGASAVTMLKSWVRENPQVLGDKIVQTWGPDLPFLFKDCVALEDLYRSHNGIAWNEGLSKLANLRILDVSSNKLTSINDIKNLTSLEDLWLNDNQIASLEGIDQASSGSREKLTTIYLERNPCISCSARDKLLCLLTLLKHELVQKKVIIFVNSIDMGFRSKLFLEQGTTKQPGGHECGYYVMRYMKKIIEDAELSFSRKWALKNKKQYTQEELDEVRIEVSDYLGTIMQ